MPDLKTLVKRTIEGLGQDFKQARADLNVIIAEIRDAIRESTTPEFKLYLSPVREDAQGEVSNLVVEIAETKRDIGAYRISPSGYPIEYGVQAAAFGGFELMGAVADKDELLAHFAEMVSNPGSPLMVFVTYHWRKQKDLKTNSEETVQD